jgi:hypothetical protein
MLSADEVARGSERQYNDQGASCTDILDGDLSEAVVTTGNVVNLKRPGEYQFHYECTNSHQVGNVATRRIIVYKTRETGVAFHQPATGASVSILLPASPALIVCLMHLTVGTMFQYLQGRPKRKQRKSTGTCSFEPKHARRGHDIHPSLDVRNHGECCAHCQVNGLCKAYTFDHSTGICWWVKIFPQVKLDLIIFRHFRLQSAVDEDLFEDSSLCDSGVKQYSYLRDVGTSVENALSSVETLFASSATKHKKT